MRDLLSPKQVALAIGVSEASLKRWCDRGMLAATRTGGGHRRITIPEVVQFVRQHGQPVIRPEVLGLPPSAGATDSSIERATSRVQKALTQGDEEQLRRIVLNLYLANHSVTDICDRVLSQAIHNLGDQWQHGQLEVYQERFACEMGMRLLRELRGLLPIPAPNAPYALGGTLEGDPYTLASCMVELCLREHGWRAESYGVGLPAATLCSAFRDKRPRLAWISVSTIADPQRFLADWQMMESAGRECGVALVAGGRALGDEIRKGIIYSSFCDHLAHLSAFTKNLHPAAVSEKATPATPDPASP